MVSCTKYTTFLPFLSFPQIQPVQIHALISSSSHPFPTYTTITSFLKSSIRVMRHMCRSSCLITPLMHNPTSLSTKTTRSRRTILSIRRFLGAYSSALSSIASPHIRRRSMRGQRIRLLAKLSIASLLLALPETTLWGAGRVAIVGGWTEGFFFLVVAD